MGLLDQVIGSVLGGALGGGQQPQRGGPGGGFGGGQGGGGLGDLLGGALGGGQGGGGGGLGDLLGGVLGGGQGQSRGGMSPIVMAILSLLASKAMSGGLGGGLGDLLGGGRGQAQPDDQEPVPRRGGSAGGGFTDGMYPGGRPAPQQQVDAGDDGQGGGGMAGLPGGLGGLIDMFTRNGQGDKIDSWIGGGQNKQVSPDDLNQALDDRTIDTLTRQTGLSRDDLLGQLSQALPGVIDQLTPKGRRPTEDEERQW